MRLSTDQWKLVAWALGFVCEYAGEIRLEDILEQIGDDGQRAARLGVEPAAFGNATRLDLKAVLMELGDRLVERGFEPAAVRYRPESFEGHRSTQMVAMFTAWLNHSPEAQQVLRELGFHWSQPAVHRPGRNSD